jgi:hypothetical protein
MPAVAGSERRDELVSITIAKFLPSKNLAFCSRSFETGFRPLTDLFALQLGERGERGQKDISDEFVLRRQVLFSERPECNAMRGKTLQVSNGRSRACLAGAFRRRSLALPR